MKTLVVYDSVYGNTGKIAQAIANALASQGDVQALRVGEARPGLLSGAALLIVGAPTHGGGPSPEMKTWLKSLPLNSLRGVKVAAFDTRVPVKDINNRLGAFFVRLVGYAATRIADGLKKAGGTLVIAPEGFCVKDTEGPLAEGEIERATAWAQQIAAKV